MTISILLDTTKQRIALLDRAAISYEDAKDLLADALKRPDRKGAAYLLVHEGKRTFIQAFDDLATLVRSTNRLQANREV